MFNPQRRAKVNDIYMQEKLYQLHLSKMKQITNSQSPKSKRQQEQLEQQRYLKRLSLSKKQVQGRISSDIKKQNHRLYLKLLQTDLRKEDNPQTENKKKHFNSYFSCKKEFQRVKIQNFTMVARMLNSSSEVPTLKQCKQSHRKNKKFSKNCRKLPSIMQHEAQFKKKLSRRYFDSADTSSKGGLSRFTNMKD